MWNARRVFLSFVWKLFICFLPENVLTGLHAGHWLGERHRLQVIRVKVGDFELAAGFLAESPTQNVNDSFLVLLKGGNIENETHREIEEPETRVKIQRTCSIIDKPD